MKKFGLFMAGFWAGVLYICLLYGGSFLLSAWSAGHGLSGKWPLILLAGLSVLGIVGFYLLSHVFFKKLNCGKYAFPIGAFLTGDCVLLAIPLLQVLETNRLVQIAGGSKSLAQTYAYLILVLIVGITCLVISWLVSMLFGQFRRFREMSLLLEAQNAELRANLAANAAHTEQASPRQTSETGEEIPTPATTSETREE